ncbi:MAG TPA: formate dehydrogenase subunit alpha [Longimicrobiales bacterium]|nr:formate dehydrogenase subunit alpha [Longimicrobiales bacterium]
MSGIDGAATSAPLARAAAPDESAHPLGPQGAETAIHRLEQRLGWVRTGEYGGEPVPFSLDGADLEARAGETILQAAQRHGVAIPRLCYMDGMRPDGNCRACVVEVEGERVLAPSCCRRPTAGMKVSAASERARTAQRMVVELLLADAPELPHDPESELTYWAKQLRVERVRLPSRRQPAPDFSHAGIEVRLDACIQCTRCVRACREVQVNDVIGYAHRGADAKIVFDLDDPMGESTCVGCGECVQACPTGALLPSLPAIVAGPLIERHHTKPAADHGPMHEASLRTAAAASPPADETVAPASRSTRGDDGAPRRLVPLVQLNGHRAPAAGWAKAEHSVASLCPYCGVGCQTTYHVADNHILSVSGRNGPSNHERLCVKGRFGFDYVHHPQRLRRPLIRRDGVPRDPHVLVDPASPLDAFREAEWEEALDLAAHGLLRIRREYGSQALAGYGSAKGSNEEAYLFQKLVRVGFGTNNVDHCTRLCHASSVAALMEGLNSGAVSNQVDDVKYADCFIIIGANPTVNHPVAATFMKNAVERGAQLILIDPRRTELSRLATHMLQFRPDTDVALLNAMLHTIVEEDLVDHDFVEQRTTGYDELVRTLRPYSPEAMQHLCGVPATQIRAAARMYATSPRSMIFWGMGISQHIHGTDNARCLIALALITGQIGRRGTGLHPLRGQNNVQGASDMGLIPMVYPDYQSVEDPDVRAFFADLWDAPNLDPKKGLTVVEIMNAAKTKDVRGMYIMGENPAMSDPDVQHARAAMASLDWLVVQDIFLTETAAFADVILPSSAFPEKTGTFTNTDRRVQLGRTAIDMPADVRQDLELIQQLARRMGLDWNYHGPAAVWAEIRRAVPSCAGITWERLEREHSVTYPCRIEGDPGEEVIFVDSFPTKNGRARIVPADFIHADELPDAEYPFVLITGRVLEHWHTGAMTRRAGVLDAIEPIATASLHPDDMQNLGVAAGDAIALQTRRGRVVATARLDTGIPRGAVFMPFAYVEAAANVLTNPKLDPFGKIPEFKYCAVRLTSASPDELTTATYGAASEL